jgi:sterol 3beta-glucosyltransferase
MKIVCSSRGSRGDVHPIIEITSALKKQGHEVSLCVPPLFDSFCRDRGLSPVLYRENSELVMQELGSGWESGRQAIRWFSRNVDEQFDLLLEATEDADVLVSSVNELAAPSVAEFRGIRHYRVAYCPVLPGAQPPPMLPWQRLPAQLNRVVWRLINASIRLFVREGLDRRRKALGLAPVGEFGRYCAGSSHTILAINSTLAPPDSDWRYPYTYSGYCFGPDHEPLDQELSRFLDAGSRPVYIGFGSVSVKDPAVFTEKILEAIRLAGCRVILGSGWTGLGQESLPENVFLVRDTPHATLFPRVAGIAHHGGSGTTHTAFRAGVPQFVMPQIADQFYWGRRIQDLGIGPAPVPPSSVTPRSLANAFRALIEDAGARSRAHILSESIRHEDGVGNASRIIS